MCKYEINDAACCWKNLVRAGDEKQVISLISWTPLAKWAMEIKRGESQKI